MTMTRSDAAPDLSERSHADLLSDYIIITAELRDAGHHRRLLLEHRATVRDTLITRLGLLVTMRFCTQVDGVMR